MSIRDTYGKSIVTAWRDLQRKYTRDKQAIHSTWLSLSPEKRKQVILVGAAGGEDGFLRHRDDPRLGVARYIIPELNLKDLVSGENLLEFLAHRATRPIVEMYPYDAHFMRASMRENKISHSSGRVRGAVMMFRSEEQYGDCMELGENAKGDEMETLIRMGNGFILNENEGSMILDRQNYIYGFLSLLVDDIMDTKRELDDPDRERVLPKRKKAAAVGSKEEIEQRLQSLQVSGNNSKKPKNGPVKLKDTLDHLVQDSQEQLLSTDDHINLIHEEPLYLAHVANHYFFSSSGMVLDGKGAREVIYNGKNATQSTLELLRDAYQAAAYWKYISLLASELGKNNSQNTSPEKIRNPLTDELWATCNKELLRIRAVYRRFVQTELKYTKYFVRSSPGQVQLKDTLQAVARKNQHASWVLQLAAKTEYSDVEVAQLLKELDAFQEAVPKARESISERMGDALGDISVVVAFMARLRKAIVVPKKTPSSSFEKEMAARTLLVEEAWEGLDLADYAFPGDNLKDAAACQDCFRAIDEKLLSSSIGLDLGNIFQEPIENCLLETLRKQAESEATRQQSTTDVPFDPFINHPPSPAEPKPPKPKKTRDTSPASASTKSAPTSIPRRSPPPKAEPIPAPPAALKTFRRLFRPDPSAIPWSAFVSAMTSIGFTIEPIGGSVARFRPPDEEGGGGRRQPINLHRPHPVDKLEGWALLRLRSRLGRSFGWEVGTFVSVKK